MYVVTGATGQLGKLVVDALLREVDADSVVAVGRNPEKAEDLAGLGVHFRQADYDQPETLAPALEGASRVLLISGSEVGKRVPQHQAVIDAARAAGAERIAYTSILHADDSPVGLATEHRATESLLAGCGIPYAILRNGWYAENYGSAVATALQFGLIGCAGDGRISAASRVDYADAAVRVLLDRNQEGRVYELAGDTAFTMSELAAEIAAQSGKPVTYTNLSQDDHQAALVQAGLPEPVAAILADADAGVAQGALFDDGRELSRLIRRPTTPIADVVRDALAGLA